MEGDPIEPALLRKKYEAVHRHGRDLGEQFQHNVAFLRLKSGYVLLAGIDDHRRALCVLFIF